MQDNRDYNHDIGFYLPENYQAVDNEVKFALALVVFSLSTAIAAFVGAQIVGLI
ncbi:hypothetical protein ACLBWS_17775 [Brucellaceae bacterium D45D]